MKIVLVCIAKDEDNYIKEWVDYHLKLGFHKIFIYENNWRCNLDFDTNLVVKIPFDGQKQQKNAYHHFLDNYKNEFDWGAFFDVDEFLVLKKHRTISDLINDYKNHDCLVVNWVFFGDNGLEKVEADNFSVLSRFTKRQIGVNQHIKSILNLKNDFRFRTPHDAKGVTWTDSRGLKGGGPFNKNGKDNIIQLNHYWCKTKEEFEKKLTRGTPDASHRSIEMFANHNFNNIDDFTALNFFKK